jgi:hypothetical protein
MVRGAKQAVLSSFRLRTQRRAFERRGRRGFAESAEKSLLTAKDAK